MNGSVSLVVPVYNALPYLKDFVKSVQDQTWRPLECIFADDGSTDGSLEYLKEKESDLIKAGIEVKILTLQHAGQASAVNDALKEVTGEYLTWCDADDIMLPRCIEVKADYLQEHPDIGLVRNEGLIITGEDGEKADLSTKEEDRRDRDIFDELLYLTCYAGCFMVRMSLFDICYPDRSIPISPEGQNLQLLMPPASRSTCGYVPEVVYHYYLRNSGHASRKRSYKQMLDRRMNFIKLYKDILPYCDCDQEYYLQLIEGLKKQYMEELIRSAVTQAREEMKKRESGNSYIS